MVIVTTHAIAAFLFEQRDPGRFLTSSESTSSVSSHDSEAGIKRIKQEKTHPESFTDFTINLLQCGDIQSLGTTVKTGLPSVVTDCLCGTLFYQDETSGEIFTADNSNVCICTPKPTCISNIFTNNQPEYTDVNNLPQCVLQYLPLQSSSNSNYSVGILPVCKRGSENILAVLVFVGKEINDMVKSRLHQVIQQIAACYNHIQRTFQSTRSVEERASQHLIRLCGELYDQDAAQLQLKVLRYLEEQTQAECAFLYLVVPETQELFCQVIGKKILQEEERFPGQNSCFSVALETKQPMTLEDIPLESRKAIEEKIECPLRSFLCVPVTSRSNNNLIALTCVANKQNANRFSDRDISCIHQCFRYTSTVLTSTLAFQNERKLKQQTQALLTVARDLFTNLDDLTKLLREIMQQARNLTHAERCSVFLIDQDTDELVAKVFDGITTKKDNEVQEEIRMPITQGIAGKVATSGELLNIKDAYSHPLFYRGIDDSTGFRTRNILCFPIKDEKGRILGVAQLCNKQNCPCFTTFDEEIATAFGIYCCISISHSLMYKKVIDSQVRNSLANELMMYHMKSLMYKKLLDTQHRKSLANELMIYHMQVSPDDVHGLATIDIPHPRMLNANFIEFSYAPRSLLEDKTLLACLSMFEDLNFISRWRIRRETIARFVLMVKKGYRNPPYHNWMHAYTVAQFCYQLIKNLKLENTLDDIELFSLFVSCLCHDIDHRGTNNSFQTASSSVLAALYSSEESVLEKSVLAALYSSEGSVLERHHFAQTMCILNTEGCNVFENLNSKDGFLTRKIIFPDQWVHLPVRESNLSCEEAIQLAFMKDYQHVLDLMREIILATDLAHHFKILKNLKELAERGVDKTSVKERKLLLCLLMTSCDLSDQTRPWENTKRVAALIYKEFFSQGDMEKAKGLEPSDMMDRERAQIPALQISFLDHVALPVYVLLGKMFSPAKEVGDRVEENKQHWIKISNLIKLKRGGSQARMTFEEVLAIENEGDDDTSHLVNGTQTIDSKC